MTLPSDPTPIEPQPVPEPDVPGGPTEPIDGAGDSEEAEILQILEDDLPGQPTLS